MRAVFLAAALAPQPVAMNGWPRKVMVAMAESWWREERAAATSGFFLLYDNGRATSQPQV